jgi:hypothetical protein
MEKPTKEKKNKSKNKNSEKNKEKNSKKEGFRIKNNQSIDSGIQKPKIIGKTDVVKPNKCRIKKERRTKKECKNDKENYTCSQTEGRQE